jgi:2-polyprenyl-6-methoxyphenol hydroxylase-like FAD-dependent oxidoreductase
VLGAGALTMQWPADVLWLSPVGWGRRFPEGRELLSASRELVEWTVRRRLQALPNVTLRDGHEVTGLLAGEDGRAVRGVRLRQFGSPGGRAGANGRPSTTERGWESGEVSSGADQPLAADLVLDASGRDSRLPQWLQALGRQPPPEDVLSARLAYASRYYARPPGAGTGGAGADWQAILLSARPDAPRTGTLVPIEGDRWLVTLASFGGAPPPTDEAGFLAFARTLRSPVLYEAIRDARPLSPIRGYRRTENRWRHYERVPSWPERLLVLGDAACAFNTVYGQGMTAAALAAQALDTCLRAQRRRRPDGALDGLARRFQRAVAQTSGAIWLLATGEDRRYPTTVGAAPSLATRLFHRYVDRLIEVATERPDLMLALLDVLHLVRPPATLLHPRVVLPTLRGRRQPPLITPPLRLSAAGTAAPAAVAVATGA